MSEPEEVVAPAPQVPAVQAVEPSSEPGEIVVLANKPDGVQASLSALSTQMDKRIEHWTANKAALEENLRITLKRKWNPSGLKKQISDAQKRIEFYTKLKAAFDAGYVPVPNMPGLDIFAIRTSAKKPKAKQRDGLARWGSPATPDQITNTPPLGEGAYVSPRPETESERFITHGKNGEEERILVRATEFDDEIDFPFVLAKPQVMETTGEALAAKLFDEMGVLPARPGSSSAVTSRRHADPMVVGNVVLRVGPAHQWKRVAFLVSWFIDTKDL